MALIISAYSRELHGDELRRGSLPPGLGIDVAIIQRRQTFCARIQSPFQNCSDDQRAADLLAGQQLEVRQFLARADVQAAPVVARELGRPLARPADDDDEALRRAIRG